MLNNTEKLLLIAGPCLIEGEEMALRIADHLKEVALRHDVELVFKGSYRKANRTSLNSFSGIGDQKALRILSQAGDRIKCPTITDIHSVQEAALAAEYVDVLQIPAFLCRQTDLLLAAGETGKVVNIKKGQFMSADSMSFAVEKVRSASAQEVWLTERGNSFGYGDLVLDMCNFPIMKPFAERVIADCTHSLQKPNTGSGTTGGKPEYIKTIALSSIAAGATGLFIETHFNRAEAKSDGANMLDLKEIDKLVEQASKLFDFVRKLEDPSQA